MEIIFIVQMNVSLARVQKQQSVALSIVCLLHAALSLLCGAHYLENFQALLNCRANTRTCSFHSQV
jgi:hypothetical protein